MVITDTSATKGVVEVASSMITSLQEDVKNGVMKIEDAKKHALDQIHDLRYHGSEYFWVNDMEPKVLMHGVNADLVGKNVTDVKDPNGKQLFVEMVKVAKEKEAGIADHPAYAGGLYQNLCQASRLYRCRICPDTSPPGCHPRVNAFQGVRRC